MGFILFCLTFIILSLKNTGEISVYDAFACVGPKGGLCIINYGLVTMFILIGIFVGWIVGKIKNRK